jgi:proteic killer suppression protein
MTLCVILWCVTFADAGAEAIFDARDTRLARKTLPQSLWLGARRRLQLLAIATSLNDLRVPPGNRLEALSGSRAGQHSIRVNDQYRICFRWTDAGPADVEIVDYH